ncbi:MAG TPA: hypothetical protein VGX76_15125, partial [Pirellulales bacterium]|nr:hypothetical protein [Pirellulales bacterium]
LPAAASLFNGWRARRQAAANPPDTGPPGHGPTNTASNSNHAPPSQPARSGALRNRPANGRRQQPPTNGQSSRLPQTFIVQPGSIDTGLQAHEAALQLLADSNPQLAKNGVVKLFHSYFRQAYSGLAPKTSQQPAPATLF